MARVQFTEVEEWMAKCGYRPADAARLFNVTTQTFNGWKKRGRVSADESDRVRETLQAVSLGVENVSSTSSGYLRVDQIDAVAGMGDAMVNDDYPEVIRSVEYTETFIRALVGFLPPPGRLKLVTGRGDSMRPTIEPGEVVLMDTGVTTFEGDAIYWITLGPHAGDDGQQIKMLQQRGDGLWVVSANPAYPAFKFPTHGSIGGKLYIKHKMERFN